MLIFPQINFIRDAGFLAETLGDAHARLAGGQIENFSYDQIVLRYDRPGTFFYLDPPYYDIRLYCHNLEHANFERMAEVLSSLKGKFLLSINDLPKVRKLFAGFHIETVKITYSLHRVAGKRHQELLISNFK